MKVSEMMRTLALNVFNKGDEDMDVKGGYTCDLLSDVMGSLNEGEVWITLQTHRNVAAVASLKDAAAIVLVKGLEPDENMMSAAQEEGLWVLGTDKQAFELSGLMYQQLL